MGQPKLAVILATDSYSAIRVAVRRWRQQTVTKDIELVLVTPDPEPVSEIFSCRNEFQNLRIVIDPLTNLAAARVAGIGAAVAPIIFLAETHCYPKPDFAAAILAAFSGPWSCIVPAFDNANPESALSWAAFLPDYGKWIDGLPAAEVFVAPLYNTAYRSLVLDELGDRLTAILANVDELPKTLRCRGHRAFFYPQAHLEHLNIANLRHWVRERFASGVLIASGRAEHWPFLKRLVYSAGSVLLPAVLLWRIRSGLWSAVTKKRPPRGTSLTLLAAMSLRAAGELAGYAGFTSHAAASAMREYELHKTDYVLRRES
ncbi:MAG: glycosyltransferase family 2 protein [Acidobacteriaceae bacterium]|nr:glycosyltransferase family 2 protein [Acidobacteriaceae bacterium]